MSNHFIIFPIIVQVVLTFSLYFLLAVRKNRAVETGRVDESRRALFDDAWPATVVAVNNCIRNQFEVPVLFYVLTILLYSLDDVSLLSLVIAWAFVVTRVAHAYVHVGSLLGVLLVVLMSGLVSKAVLAVS